MLEESTPLMKQYWDLKAEVPGALLLFRMGDFYELFGEDAVIASRILEIVLTSRDKNKENPIPMAGVPHHSAQNYIQRLLKAGKKVAIGEQMEEARAGKGIVRREIVRVFTPAIQFEEEGARTAYLSVGLRLGGAGDPWLFCCLDVATGEGRVSDALSLSEFALEISSLPIAHFLSLDQGIPLPEEIKSALGSALLETLPSNTLSLSQAEDVLRRQFGLHSPETLFGFLPAASFPGAIQGFGILLAYAARTQKRDLLSHLRPPAPLHRKSGLQLGPRTPQHLDLLPTQDAAPCLYDLINYTRSALGGRELKRSLLEPLASPTEIHKRQEAVQELRAGGAVSKKISDAFAELYDLERICGRIQARLANPRDTLALGKSLALLPELSQLLTASQSEILSSLKAAFDQASAVLLPLAEKIGRTQREDAPLSSKEGGIFKVGTTPELDHLLSLTENGQRFLVELEVREREATQIPSLKVRYNRVFGYYIEVTHAHLKNVPSHYQRKQTMVGAERFFTEELKKFEEEILTASTRQKALEQALFEELLQTLAEKTKTIMEAAGVLSQLDVLCAFACLAEEPGWVFPEINDSLALEIEAGRHPMVDAACRGAFVPNALSLRPEDDRRILLITGPNMGGKSTVMRQVALMVILGQMGAPVPAKRARWGVFSSLFTRIGAQDAIARGQSTFMVEMSELAQILRSADERSLLVLDEIGRGTSTYDGISVAWATLEWIAERVRARTLFATHYHELTQLAGRLVGVANAHMAVESARSTSLRFLYQLCDGPTADSFGIHVAKLAGLPEPVIVRSWKILEELERGGFQSGLTLGKNIRKRKSDPALPSEGLPPEQQQLVLPF